MFGRVEVPALLIHPDSLSTPAFDSAIHVGLGKFDKPLQLRIGTKSRHPLQANSCQVRLLTGKISDLTHDSWLH